MRESFVDCIVKVRLGSFRKVYRVLFVQCRVYIEDPTRISGGIYKESCNNKSMYGYMLSNLSPSPNPCKSTDKHWHRCITQLNAVVGSSALYTLVQT